MIKLNIGCWKRNFPGFINIDVIGYPHVHFQRSADDLSMFDDNSVDLVYASHVLEYFTYNDARKALAEWCRVLKPGGELKVCVPDLEALIRVYQKYKDPMMLRGSIYAITDKVLEHDGQLIFHKMIYDEALLSKTLEECGFTGVKRYDWKEFLERFFPEGDVDRGAIDRSAGYIPSNDRENGILTSLNLQAVKAGPLEAATIKTKHLAEHLTQKVINKAVRIFRGQSRKKELYRI